MCSDSRPGNELYLPSDKYCELLVTCATRGDCGSEDRKATGLGFIDGLEDDDDGAVKSFGSGIDIDPDGGAGRRLSEGTGG